jgi:hypothetical protein
MTIWNIYKPDGSYVGQSRGHSAAAAFCQYMSLFSGPKPVLIQDIEADEIEPIVFQITYNGEVYIARGTTA